MPLKGINPKILNAENPEREGIPDKFGSAVGGTTDIEGRVATRCRPVKGERRGIRESNSTKRREKKKDTSIKEATSSPGGKLGETA